MLLGCCIRQEMPLSSFWRNTKRLLVVYHFHGTNRPGSNPTYSFVALISFYFLLYFMIFYFLFQYGEYFNFCNVSEASLCNVICFTITRYNRVATKEHEYFFPSSFFFFFGNHSAVSKNSNLQRLKEEDIWSNINSTILPFDQTGFYCSVNGCILL